MSALLLLGVLLIQEPSPITVVPDTPTETTWPILGKANRPDGTILKFVAVRVERRWDPTAEKFREFQSPEGRLTRSTEVGNASYKTSLKNGATGLYEVAVNEGDQRLYSGRMLLGSPKELFLSMRRSVGKIAEVCDRAQANLDELQKILAGKAPGNAAAREAFIKRVYADEQFLQELGKKTDLTATAFLLNDLCAQIRNAQVWELPSGTKDEELNDGKVGDRDIFLDPKLTFTNLRAQLAGAKAVAWREVSLSAATIVDRLLARAEDKSDRLLSRAKDAASEAIKVLGLAAVEDKDAKTALEAVTNADSAGIPEVRKGLKSILTKHLADP